MKRIDWDSYFMQICNIVSLRATCPRKSVGAVVVKNNRIISTGYNGAPKGMKHCGDAGCKIIDNHCVRVVHAEMNALLFAGREAEGATLYCTCLPCTICMKMAIQQGIKRIVYQEDYNNGDLQWIIKESRIKIEQFPICRLCGKKMKDTETIPTFNMSNGVWAEIEVCKKCASKHYPNYQGDKDARTK